MSAGPVRACVFELLADVCTACKKRAAHTAGIHWHAVTACIYGRQPGMSHTPEYTHPIQIWHTHTRRWHEHANGRPSRGHDMTRAVGFGVVRGSCSSHAHEQSPRDHRWLPPPGHSMLLSTPADRLTLLPKVDRSHAHMRRYYAWWGCAGALSRAGRCGAGRVHSAVMIIVSSSAMLPIGTMFSIHHGIGPAILEWGLVT